MPITLKLGELLAAKPALERLGQLRFSITTSYKMVRRIKVINVVLMRFDAQRAALARELGTPIKDSPNKIRLRQVTPEQLQAARDDVKKKKEMAASCQPSSLDSDVDEEEYLTSQIKQAEADLKIMEAEAESWHSFVAKTNDLMMIDETISIDPIRLSELQPPENTICPKCQRSPNELTVDDVMLLYPLLAPEN